MYGGNTGNETISDVWVLNVDKSPFTWERLTFPSESPLPDSRVYHTSALCTTGMANGMIVIFGGRNSTPTAINDTWGLRRHRDGRWDWVKAPYKNSGEKPIPRYQHSSIFVGSMLIITGGRSNLASDTVPMEIYDTETSDWFKYEAPQRFRHATFFCDNFLFMHGGFNQETPNTPTDIIIKLDLSNILQEEPQLSKYLLLEVSKYDGPSTGQNQSKPQSNSNKVNPYSQKSSNSIKLVSEAFMAVNGADDDMGVQVTKIPINKLRDEPKKIGLVFEKQSLNAQQIYCESLYSHFVSYLLAGNSEALTKDLVLRLIEESHKVFMAQPVFLRLKVPIKIFGNINGQLDELLKLFEHFGNPGDTNLEGDIEGINYLFLGDMINLGKQSLEVICLLLAFKIRFPDEFFLIRGHHEDKKMARIFGLGDECFTKFKEDIDDKESVFQKLCELFEVMPVAAELEQEILCVHGGIGVTLNKLEEIDELKRPLDVNYKFQLKINFRPVTNQHKILLDLLWSDPPYTDEDARGGANPTRDIFATSHIHRFGMDRVKSFMKNNNLGLMIRSHEPTVDGIEKCGDDSIITIFSVSHYMDEMKNSSAILIIRRNGEIIPKIYNPGDKNSTQKTWIQKEENLLSLPDSDMNLRRKKATPPRRKAFLKK